MYDLLELILISLNEYTNTAQSSPVEKGHELINSNDTINQHRA